MDVFVGRLLARFRNDDFTAACCTPGAFSIVKHMVLAAPKSTRCLGWFGGRLGGACARKELRAQTLRVHPCLGQIANTHLHTYICMFMHVYIYRYMCTHLHILICMHTPTHVCTYTHRCVYTHAHICMHAHICTYSSVYLRMYMCAHVHILMWIHIYIHMCI